MSIAAAEPTRLISSRVLADPLDRLFPRLGAAATVVLGFVTFMPYPAIPFGTTSALQMGEIVSFLLLIPVLGMPWRYRPIHIFPLILVPLVLSAVKVALTNGSDVDLCFKSSVVWLIIGPTLIVTQMYAPRYGLQLLTGIAIVTILHAAVGFWQVYCFTQGEFPFADFYVNQSLGGVQETAEVIAKYIQRPFGFFSEPSAMACSLAPWIIFWTAELCGIVRLREQPARWQRVLFAIASVSGLVLIILSASGHTSITLAGVLFIGLLWFRKLKATPRSFAAMLLIMGVLLPLILWLAVTTLSNRVDSEYQNKGSWDERSGSLAIGFACYAHGDLPTLLFGLGTGLSSVAVWKAGHFATVSSVSLSYIYETGFVGALVVVLIGLYLLRVWRASGLNPAFAAITIVWFVGITLTTSFQELLPIWVTLGWLTVWPAICAPANVKSDSLPQ